MDDVEHLKKQIESLESKIDTILQNQEDSKETLNHIYNFTKSLSDTKEKFSETTSKVINKGTEVTKSLFGKFKKNKQKEPEATASNPQETKESPTGNPTDTDSLQNQQENPK